MGVRLSHSNFLDQFLKKILKGDPYGLLDTELSFTIEFVPDRFASMNGMT